MSHDRPGAAAPVRRKSHPPREGAGLPEVIGRLARAMDEGAFSRVEIAELRRMDVNRPLCSAFLRTLETIIRPLRPQAAAEETAWAIILSGMARMLPRPHHPGRPSGAVLSEAGCPEKRFLNFLNATDASLPRALDALARFLATRDEALDWSEPAALLILKEPQRREALKRKIARDYYHLGKTSPEAPR